MNRNRMVMNERNSYGWNDLKGALKPAYLHMISTALRVGTENGQ
jgi:hypothetical protein